MKSVSFAVLFSFQLLHAPVYEPDENVTKCQLCEKEFTFTFRRHHCRACGKVSVGHMRWCNMTLIVHVNTARFFLPSPALTGSV